MLCLSHKVRDRAGRAKSLCYLELTVESLLPVTLCVNLWWLWSLTEGSENRFSLEDFGFLVFHSPYCKLVQKSLARLMLNDFLSHPRPDTETGPFTGLEAFRYEWSMVPQFKVQTSSWTGWLIGCLCVCTAEMSVQKTPTLTGTWRRPSWRPAQICLRGRPSPHCSSPTRMETCTRPPSMAAWRPSSHSKFQLLTLIQKLEENLRRILLHLIQKMYQSVLQTNSATAGRTENRSFLLRLRFRRNSVFSESDSGPHPWWVSLLRWCDKKIFLKRQMLTIFIFWFVVFFVFCFCFFVTGSSLDKLVSSISDLELRLNSRRKVSPDVFSENMKLREETHHLGTSVHQSVTEATSAAAADVIATFLTI